MIQILFLIPTLNRGGAENVLVDLVNHMDQNKFKITVQTLFDKDAQRNRLKEGIEYRSFLYHQFRGNSRLFARIPARLLYRIIVRKRYDIVVSFLEGPTTHIISGCPYSDSKRVAWIHSALDTSRGFTAGFASWKAAVKAYRGCDKIVYVAKSVKEKIEETAGIAFSNACVLYNPINATDIRKRSKEELNDLVFPKDEFCIISTGKVAPVKGYDRLARVQKRLKQTGYKTHVYIIGRGKQKDEIQRYVDENELTDTITFLGFQENPYKYVVNADLFVCSSRREGFSTATTESLILGIPVCTTDVSGMKEMLGEGNEYGIITQNNEDALYEGIKRLLDDTVLLTYYRNKAKERGNTFGTENNIKAIEKMLLSLR